MNNYKVGDYIKCKVAIWRKPSTGFPAYWFDELPTGIHQIFFDTTKDKLYKIEDINPEQNDTDSDSLSCYITSDQGYKIRVLIYENKYEKLKTFWYYFALIRDSSAYKRGKLISKNEYFVKATELEIDMINYNL